MTDRRERPWRKLRVVVEVTVPPTSRASEKDLMYAVREAMPYSVKLPRPVHKDHHDSVVRLKTFNAFWPAFRKAQAGIVNVVRRSTHKPLPKPDVDYNGL